MAEKKVTKKTTKKPEEKAAPVVEKAVIAENMEIKTPVYPSHVEQDLSDDIKEDEISKEIAKTIKETAGKPDRYFEAIGRRKTAVGRVRLFTKGDKEFIVNNQPYQKYFQTVEDQETAVASMKKMKCLDKFRITVKVKGGGHRAQAEAIRHGTARVLVDFNQNFRKRLRKAGFLTRDPRMRERKKFGLKRARRAPQWAKR
jgi:small subunit ribosomal protein S9